jgi:ABC-type uncharacterized transport system permease subunit
MLAHGAWSGRDTWRVPALLLGIAGFAVHSWLLLAATGVEPRFSLSISDTASAIGWLIAGMTLLAAAWRRYRAVPAVLLAVAGVLALGTGTLGELQAATAPPRELSIHIAMAITAAALLSAGAVLVILLAIQDAELRRRPPATWLRLLPPIESMEQMVFIALGAGFSALTLVLVTGFLFVHDLFAQHLVHKTVLTIIAWLIFAVLLFGRLRFGWRGRKALRFTIAGYLALVLAYFGSKFVLEVLLGKHWG